jgi:pyruvate kinase
MRKTKIVCTLGPSTDNEEVLRQLMYNGMDVARVNFSHGTHEQQLVRINQFKKVREETGLPIALLLDTKGPEIRIKTFRDQKVTLKNNELFTLVREEIEGDETRVSVTYPSLARDLHPGDRVLIDDGLVELNVVKMEEGDVVCRVINGGTISDRKSINIPNVSIQIPYISEQDEADLIFGIENDFDFIAASFVRNQFDVLEVRRILERNGGKDIQIIAKLENQDGVINAEQIIKVSDGIMVARGDMGVEIALEDLPSIQKKLIKDCYYAGKKVITATQMLDSMIRNPRPTRAETTDVANAIYDGTSAIMLSGETAVGKYPVESVKTMASIAQRAEQDINYKKRFSELSVEIENNITNAISHATCMTAHDLEAAAIIAVTNSGHTARMVSRFRPQCKIIAPTISERVRRQLNLSWGVIPLLSEVKETTDDLFEHVVDLAVKGGYVHNGDIVVITGGIPLGVTGTTNILKVHLVGHVLAEGTGINSLNDSGRVCVADSAETALRNFKEGDILVVPKTTNEMLPIIKKAKGIICEEEGIAIHAAIVGMALDIPVITGVHEATKLIKNGTIVTMESSRGLIYAGVTKLS